MPNFFFFFCLFRAAPAAYGGSQARGRIGATAASLHHSWIWTASATYTAAQGNARSLTHWVRPGIKPISSWILVRFVTTKPQQELPELSLLLDYNGSLYILDKSAFATEQDPAGPSWRETSTCSQILICRKTLASEEKEFLRENFISS